MEVRIPYSTMLSQPQVEEVHETSLKILQEIGVSTDSRTILKLCEDAGAQVDVKSGRIRISKEMVENSFKTIPRNIKLYGRDPQNDIVLKNGSVYFGLGGTGVPYIRDLDTEAIRTTTKKDVENSTRLGDALSGISFVMTLASASDCPGEVQYLHELEVKFNNTMKPILHPVPGTWFARKVLEMAETVAGGTEEFQKRPNIGVISENLSPLYYSRETENIIEFAKKKAPVVLLPAPTLASTGPGTMIGTFCLANAESLFGIVLSQLTEPGAPVVMGPAIGIMDMRTTKYCYTDIGTCMGKIMTAQMARFYGLPSFCAGTGASDAKIPDAQAGAEAALSALIGAQSGVNIVYNVGTMAGGTLGSFELAVIGDEVIGMIQHLAKGVTVNSETLAFDVLKEIGPEGNFLSHNHTLSLFRKELYFPKLFNRESVQTWLKKGERNIFDEAKERAKEIIRNHKVPALSEAQQADLSKIIKEAAR
ncbi:MAG: trimethylamine methyltransferase family protein [Desulfobacterales bacterium]